MPERVEMALIISGITFVVFLTIGIFCEREKHKSFHSMEWGLMICAAGVLALGVFVYGMFDSSYSMEPKTKSANSSSYSSVSSRPAPTPITNKTASPQMKQSISKFVDRIVGSTAEPSPTPKPERKGMVKPTYSEYEDYAEFGYIFGYSSNDFYVVNTYSMKYHRPSCEYARQISFENIQFWFGPKGNLGIMGYNKCKVCTP